ncbi:MAG: lysophospholipid acyltransferase family protein [Proteobacteria bacterium]|nr:lysophospholipid acyltransferase family protein [Pseudomonadota bacterium]
MNNEVLIRLAPIIAGIRAYHHHTIVGADEIPRQGSIIFAVNHSLASYDIALLMAGVYEAVNRIPRSLIDRLFYKVPGLGPVMEALGSREGTHDNAIKLLSAGEIIVLAPGGMRESLRPSSEKYKIIWSKRKGFVKLSIETQTPIMLAACPAADDMYDVAGSHVTAWAYKTFKIPLFFAKGAGISPFPKPVRLTHYLSEPIVPPKMPDDKEQFVKVVDEFHQEVCDRMQKLMDSACAQEKLRNP